MNRSLEQVEGEIRTIIETEFPDVFVVDVLFSHGNRNVLSIWVDTDEGIGIDVCARLGRKVNHYFEEEDPFDFAFTVEVSSPGVGQPLKLRRQYHKNVGRKLKVVRVDGTVQKGKLDAVNDDSIVLRPKPKKKRKKGEAPQAETLTVPFEDIKEAKVEISFD